MDGTISAIVAVAGTILGAVLAYLFQSRASARAEASAVQQELRAQRMSVFGSYIVALTEFSRGQTDWYNRRKEDPGSAATLTARVESYRLKAVAQGLLAQVRLVADDASVVGSAISAFTLTRPVHYAEDPADLRSRIVIAEEALESFIAAAAAEVQSTRIAGHASKARCLRQPVPSGELGEVPTQRDNPTPS
jgi:hypothetical protein